MLLNERNLVIIFDLPAGLIIQSSILSKFMYERDEDPDEVEQWTRILRLLQICVAGILKPQRTDQHTFFIKVVSDLVKYNISNFEVHRSSTTPDIQGFFKTKCFLLERDSSIALLHHLQMSESGSLSDKGSPSSSSRFEPAMSGSSWPLLESLTRGTIKLSGQELADVEKVLRVPKEDRYLVEKVGKKVETSTKKRRAPMLVPSEDILFHKEARKHRVRPIIKTKSREEILKVAASKKAEAEAIGCAAAIVAGEDRRLLPPLPIINPIFPPGREHIGQEGDPSFSSKGKDKEEVGSVPWKDLKVAMRPKDFGYINNCLAGRRFTFDELGEPLAKDESDCDRMLKLSSYVMAEYHDRLREAERCKVKLKENKQLVNDARKTSKALAEAIQVKDQHFESLKRRNGENLRLKVQLEATKKQLETTMLEVSKVKGELDSALVEVSELKSSIPAEKEAAVNEFLGSQAFLHVLRPRCAREVHFEKRKWMAVLDRYDDGSVLRKYREEIDEHHRKGETFDLAVYSSSADESSDDASADEQGHQSDMIRGSTLDEDD
ncbi:uncharacterized protein [Malus domestica]|uniref:uncharacterized protein n=1 Tax=Malus domestica TaxID=3750 RepID=UPI003975DF39